LPAAPSASSSTPSDKSSQLDFSDKAFAVLGGRGAALRRGQEKNRPDAFAPGRVVFSLRLAHATRTLCLVPDRGVLVVLDPRNIEGGSPQAEPGWPADMPPGSEKFYVLFPVADVEALEAPYHTIETIDDMGGGKLTMRSRWCNIYYTLDYGLAPVSAQQSTLLEIKHRQALDGGLITSRLGGAYLEDLKLQFSYFTGTGWSKPPTMTKIWEESPRQ